ncbi:RhoGAP-domain-containing protein [Balamuthia mandrillaris]
MLQYLCKQHGLQSDSFDSWQDPSLLPLFRTLSKRSLSPHIIFTVERCVPNLLAELSSEGTEPVKEDREYFSKQRVETCIVFSAYYHIRSGSYKSIYEMLRFLLPPLPFQTLPATLFQWSSVLFSLSSSPLPEETMEHLFLPLVIILFHAAWDYAGFLFQLGGRTEGAGRETGGQQATNLTDGSMLVMLRDPSQELQQQALSANRKVLRHESLVSVQHNLRIILECLLRLRHPGVASRFQSLCECWNVSRWVWFQFSVADAFLYSRNYQDGARVYETLLSKSYREIWEQTSISCSDLSFIFDGRAASQRRQGELYSLRLRLQRGCCLFHAGAIEEAKRSLLEILVELPPQGRTTSRQGPHTPNKKRKFMPEVWSSPLSSENHSDSSLGIYFWPLCEKNLFYHSLELLIHSYKASGQLEAVLVLMQFEWPYYQQACQTVIRAIHKEQEQRGLGGFRWNMGPYLPFLVNMDILEELVAMCLRSEMRDRGAQHHPHPHSPTEAFQSRQQLERHIVAISDEHVDPEAAVLACLARFFQQALRAALISGEPEPHQQPQQPQLPQRPAPPRHSQLQQQLQPQPMQQQGSHARRSDAASPSSSSF